MAVIFSIVMMANVALLGHHTFAKYRQCKFYPYID